jgi:hypothetical protein
MGTKSGFVVGVVAALGLAAACGGRYDVGIGASGGAGGSEDENEAGGEGGAPLGTGGTADSAGGNAPGPGASGGTQAIGGSGPAGGTGQAGGSSQAGGSGPVAGAGGFASAGSGSMSDPRPGDVLGRDCPDFLAGEPTGPFASQTELWDRVSRVVTEDTRPLSNPELEEPAEMVRSYIDPISSLTPPAGLREFIDVWAFEDAGFDDEASRWGGALFMHGGSLDGLFAPFGDSEEGRASFASEPVFLSAYPSPSDRGKRLLRALFCENVGTPPEETSLGTVPEGMTRRDWLGEMVATPACLGCHTYLDPLGFSLEHFDAVGEYRETDNGLPVDASGPASVDYLTFEFESFTDLAPQLAGTPEVAACVTRSLFEYTLQKALPDGEPRAATQGELDYALCEFDRNQYSGQKLLEAIVSTPTFKLE